MLYYQRVYTAYYSIISRYPIPVNSTITSSQEIAAGGFASQGLERYSAAVPASPRASLMTPRFLNLGVTTKITGFLGGF